MSTIWSRIILWVSPCLMFLWNNEIVSLLALAILLVLFIGKIIAEREKCRG